MTSNVREFNAALDEFIGKQVPAIAVAAQKKITLDALAGMVRKSPVDTGRFRGNWQVSQGAPISTPTAQTDKSPRGSAPGSAAVTQATGALANLRPYGLTFVQNNLPYAERLENGWSKQAPGGMVALTLAELASQIIVEVRR